MPSLTERYADKISGVLGCLDRVILQGTLPVICYAKGMTNFLKEQHVNIFDYTQWAEPLRDALRENAERLAKENGLTIEYISKNDFRKEARIRGIIAERGDHPGLVHIFSVLEPCSCYRPWHEKSTGRTFLKPVGGKCLHYYFYLIDPEYGLVYVRVTTWCPFRLQIYFNGHNVLAARLRKEGIGFRTLDNSFVQIDDWAKAQELANDLDTRHAHSLLDEWAERFCPVMDAVGQRYHWSLAQVEYSTDVVFKRRADLAPVYENLVRTAVHAVKVEHVGTFLGRKMNGNFTGEAGSDFNLRITGTRVRHHLGPAAIKMYDKHGIILRVETTVHDVSFFKHHRTVEHRDGTRVFKLAPLRKSIYSLPDLVGLMGAANTRYLAFVAELDDPSAGLKDLNRVCAPRKVNGRTYKGFNFFEAHDQKLFEVLLRGEYTISGLRHKDILRHFPDCSPGFISRLLKRLRTHGLLKRVGRTYKYYLTDLGRKVAVTGLSLRTFAVVPRLAAA